MLTMAYRMKDCGECNVLNHTLVGATARTLVRDHRSPGDAPLYHHRSRPRNHDLLRLKWGIAGKKETVIRWRNQKSRQNLLRKEEEEMIITKQWDHDEKSLQKFVLSSVTLVNFLN